MAEAGDLFLADQIIKDIPGLTEHTCFGGEVKYQTKPILRQTVTSKGLKVPEYRAISTRLSTQSKIPDTIEISIKNIIKITS